MLGRVPSNVVLSAVSEALTLVDFESWLAAEEAGVVESHLVSWESSGPGDAVPTPFSDIDLGAFYDQLDSVATT